jgi:hypothetical protein
MDTIVILIILVAFGWEIYNFNKRNPAPKKVDLQECPVCRKISAKIEDYTDYTGTVQLLHCLLPQCNARVKNWDGPNLKEEREIKDENNIIDLANERTLQQQKKLTGAVRRLALLQEKTAEIVRKEQEIIAGKNLPAPGVRKEELIDFPNKDAASEVLSTMVLGTKATIAEEFLGREMSCGAEPREFRKFNAQLEYLESCNEDGEERTADPHQFDGDAMADLIEDIRRSLKERE